LPPFSDGFIEFMDAKHTLNDVYGLDSIKAWLRQDVALWRKNDLAALPKGYLLCGQSAPARLISSNASPARPLSP